MWQSKGTGEAGAMAGFSWIPESHPQPHQSRSSCALFKMGLCIGSHDAHLCSKSTFRTQVADKEDKLEASRGYGNCLNEKRVRDRDPGKLCNSDISFEDFRTDNVTATKCFVKCLPMSQNSQNFYLSTSKGYFIPPHFK